MEISSKKELIECLNADSTNFKSQLPSWKNRLRQYLYSTPISEQKNIWAYIKHMAIGQNCVIVKDIEDGQTVVLDNKLRFI